MLVDVDTTEVWLIMSLIIAQGLSYVSFVSDPELLIIFFQTSKIWSMCDGSLIGNEPPYRSRVMYISVVSDPEELIIFFKLLLSPYRSTLIRSFGR